MVYQRMVSEAYSIAQAARISCGRLPVLDEALRRLKLYLDGLASPDVLEEVVDMLYHAAQEARVRGCLDWYRVEEAARILEQALG